jgi:hypothetical protein
VTSNISDNLIPDSKQWDESLAKSVKIGIITPEIAAWLTEPEDTNIKGD